MTTVIGCDIGHSSMKIVAASGKRTISLFIPSHACTASSIARYAGEEAKKETVRLEGRDWFFGRTAILQCRNVPTARFDDWIETPDYAALFLGGLKALKDAGLPGVDDALIVLGLSARTFDTRRQTFATLLSRYAPAARIKILPQPAGPYYEVLLDGAGFENPERKIEGESWAIIQVGQYTTDSALFENGLFIRRALGSCSGVRVAAQELQRIVQARHGIEMGLVEASEAIHTRRIANFGSTLALDAEVSEASRIIIEHVLGHADQFLADEARKLTGVILAGGGAQMVYPQFKKHWPTTVVPHNPRFSVASGFCRFGQGLARWQQQKEEKQKTANEFVGVDMPSVFPDPLAPPPPTAIEWGNPRIRWHFGLRFNETQHAKLKFIMEHSGARSMHELLLQSVERLIDERLPPLIEAGHRPK